MKKLAMFLGCGMLAFAIGCGDGGGGTPPANPTAPTMDPNMMKEMQKGTAEAVSDPAGEKKEDPAAEKKEEAGEKKEEKKE